MKVVVFGGSGFLGSHVADALTNAGYDVVVYDRKVSSYLQGSQKMVVGDIMDKAKVETVVKDAYAVYDFAGIADIEKANQKPLDTIRFNILGASFILDACVKAQVKRVVFASSVYVYSKSGGFYTTTKRACEMLIENYNEVMGLPYTILRYGSLYGPRSNESNFIHRILQQALTEKKIVRQGDGEEIREYIHVYDAAKNSVDVLSEEFVNKSVIITGSQQMKVKDLLIMIKEMLGNKLEIKYDQKTTDYHYEITPYAFTPKLAIRFVGKTYIDLGQGLLKCMEDLYKDLNLTPAVDEVVVNKE